MTYGDYIRQMDDDQLASLLDSVQTDGFLCALSDDEEAISFYGCYEPSDWRRLLITEQPPEGEPPKFGIM